LGLDTELLDDKQMFYRNLLAGHFHKDLIRVILEESGYEVYPYGYESFLTSLKIKFEKGEIEPTEISKKIRSTPKPSSAASDVYKRQIRGIWIRGVPLWI